MKFQTNQLLKLRFLKFMMLITFKKWCVDLEVKLRTSKQNGGVRDVKIVLNPRIFNTATREQWELYRNEFWNKETIRRRLVLQKEQDKDK
ncbi:hypothetical protein CANARDRAFT_29836 [[Candida] arabinofermentans NRRL YB-2248]|uniref:Uncharacterized protein n=1 Tax=[Candida] arabinofermentans NRRL YB-2248 TaxID=983967 RepID=A0A1E4SVS6_9ASCO|nr:hypothetical protein CANARDRAFT_29836 [[Candida] arabinofermentans NRRL YB-2248]